MLGYSSCSLASRTRREGTTRGCSLPSSNASGSTQTNSCPSFADLNPRKGQSGCPVTIFHSSLTDTLKCSMLPSFVNASSPRPVLPVFIPRPSKVQSESSISTVEIVISKDEFQFPKLSQTPTDEKDMSYEPCFGHAY